MDIRVPVEASVKCGRQFACRMHIGVAVYRHADVIGILIVKHFSASPAKRAAAAGSIATAAPGLAVAAKLIEDKFKRAANKTIARMQEFLRLDASSHGTLGS